MPRILSPVSYTHLDVGIAGGKGEGLVFKKGQVIKKVPEDRLVDELFKEIDKILCEKRENKIRE